MNSGVKTFTCSCGATKTESIPATGNHSYTTSTIHHDAVTHTVHHDEVGHNEVVPCQVFGTVCNGCHKIVVNSSSAWYKENASKMVSWSSNVDITSTGYGGHDCDNWGSYHSEVVQVGMINTYVVDKAAYDETATDKAAWDEKIVDKAAWDEKVTKCSVCGKVK